MAPRSSSGAGPAATRQTRARPSKPKATLECGDSSPLLRDRLRRAVTSSACAPSRKSGDESPHSKDVPGNRIKHFTLKWIRAAPAALAGAVHEALLDGGGNE